MRRVFVTGATGFVGQHLLPALESGERQVTCLDGDLRDPARYRDALQGHDAVVHLAAVTGKASPADYVSVNEEGTLRLVEAAREAGVERFVLVSSIAARFDDVRRYPYARSKIAAEQIVAASGLEWNVVRPTIVVGPDSPVLTSLAKLAGAPVVPMFGGGRARVQPVSVDDLVRALATLCDDAWTFESGTTYDFGGGDVLTMREFLLKIRATLWGKKPRSMSVPAPPLAWTLGVLERFMLGALPFTAGQLASFTQDGVAEPNALMDRLAPLEGVDVVLERVARDR